MCSGVRAQADPVLAWPGALDLPAGAPQVPRCRRRASAPAPRGSLPNWYSIVLIFTYDDDESAGVPGCTRAADPVSRDVDREDGEKDIENESYVQKIRQKRKRKRPKMCNGYSSARR